MSNRITAAILTGIAAFVPAAASGGGEGGPEGMSLVTPQWGLIIWTTVTFVLLALLLSRVAWKPLLGAIEERERTIEESLDQARRDREEAASLLEEQRKLIASGHRERAEALERAQKEAERLKSEILDEARVQKDHILEQTREQVDASVAQARNDLRALAVDLAVQAAGKLLDRNVDDATQRKLVEDHLSDLETKKTPGSVGPPS